MNPTLDVIVALCHELDQPQTRYPAVQIVGTNGKTSTARAIEALLRAEGLRTGLTTSPALTCDRGRILIDGTPLPLDEWNHLHLAIMRAADAAAARHPDLPPASEFEAITAMALSTFAEHAVDVAVVETGIGGTWDATCILNPAVVVYTSVSLEHTAILGDTVEAIAHDKAGAIKPGTTVILSDGVTDGTAREIIKNQAERLGVLLLTEPVDPALRALVGNLTTSAVTGSIVENHIPRYQHPNLKAAITAAEALLGRALTPATVTSVLASLTFPGRFEVLERDAEGNAWILFDGAHNPEAADRLAEAVADALASGLLTQKPLVALGVLNDKDLAGIIHALDGIAAGFLALQAGDATRARDRGDIVSMLGQHATKPIIDTWDGARPLLVTGSLTLYETARQFARFGTINHHVRDDVVRGVWRNNDG